MSGLTRDRTAAHVPRDQILRHARGQIKHHFPCSADRQQDWQPDLVDVPSRLKATQIVTIDGYKFGKNFRRVCRPSVSSFKPSTPYISDTFCIPHVHYIPIIEGMGKERRRKKMPIVKPERQRALLELP